MISKCAYTNTDAQMAVAEPQGKFAKAYIYIYIYIFSGNFPETFDHIPLLLRFCWQTLSL